MKIDQVWADGFRRYAGVRIVAHTIDYGDKILVKIRKQRNNSTQQKPSISSFIRSSSTTSAKIN
eukprot:NP_498466.1 Uncharacterized protein CELE_M01G4.1 [Caenorhabditis elegans]